MFRKNFPNRKAQKHEQAEARQQAWSLLTIDDQLKELMHRPGNSARQVARLNKLKEAGLMIAPKGSASEINRVIKEAKKETKAPPKSDIKATKAFKKKNKGQQVQETDGEIA